MRAAIPLVLGLLSGCWVDNPRFMVGREDEAGGGTDSTGAATGPGEAGDATTTVPTSGGEGTSGGASGDADTTAGLGGGATTSAASTGGTTGDETSTGETTGAALACGDGSVQGAEICDDGNDAPADACERNCRPLFLPIESAMAKHGRDLAVGDIDGDGVLDLVVPHAVYQPGDPDVSVGLGQGDGTFVWTENGVFGLLGGRWGLVGRYSGDARPDIMLVPSDGASTLQLLVNASQPGLLELALPQVIVGLGYISYVTARTGDIDGDALDDVLAINTFTDRLYVRRNGVDGFKPHVSFTTKDAPVDLAAGLLTPGDTDLDVVVAYPGSPELGVFVGDGNGGLVAGAPVVACPDGTVAVTVGDADGGGPQDITATCQNGGTVLRIGHDGVAPYTHTLGPDLPEVRSAATLDLYGDDARADVFAVAPKARQIVVAAQVDGGLTAPLLVPLTWEPSKAVAGDFNGDGAPDIAVLHPNDGQVTVLVNQGRLPPP